VDGVVWVMSGIYRRFYNLSFVKLFNYGDLINFLFQLTPRYGFKMSGHTRNQHNYFYCRSFVGCASSG
jgi:hypothetical protein